MSKLFVARAVVEFCFVADDEPVARLDARHFAIEEMHNPLADISVREVLSADDIPAEWKRANDPVGSTPLVWGISEDTTALQYLEQQRVEP